jgi:hypothetical protein
MAKEGAMMAIPLEFNLDRAGAARTLVTGLVRWRLSILAFAVGFPIVFYLLLLGVLIVKYGYMPNYITRYDWIGNVLRIIHHTPSVSDMVPIILNEWLLEIGHIDYDYGHGVADWSLSIVPHKLAIMSLAGALIGLNVTLLLERQTAHPQTLSQQCVLACRSGFLTSLGALCAGLTSATVFSVACCAVPTWAGSLTILGVETSLAFAIEPYGPIASLLGIGALIVSALWIARGGGAELSTPRLASPQGAQS